MKFKATGLLNLDKSKILNESMNKKNPVIFTLCAVVGIVFGVVLQTIDETVHMSASQVFTAYSSNLPSIGFMQIFLGYLLYNCLFIIAALFMGLCAIGFPFLYAVPFVKGLGIGSVLGYIYAFHGIKGVLYSALTVFPAAAIEFFAINLACNESYQMSLDILNVIKNRKRDNAEPDMKLYIIRYLIIFAVLTISSVVYSICSKLFFNIIS